MKLISSLGYPAFRTVESSLPISLKSTRYKWTNPR